jgi:ParB/RepB/Spo0J family partition protein
MPEEEEFLEVPLESLIPSDYQLHENVSEEEFDKLVQSIMDIGQRERIVVKRVGDKFKILSGNTRYQALKAAGIPTAKIVVKKVETPEDELKEIYHDNIRVKVNPIDEARFFQKTLTLFGGDIEKMGDALKISRTHIKERLKLLEYPPDVQIEILNDNIPLATAKWLAKIDDPIARAQYLKAAVEGGMNEAVAHKCYQDYVFMKKTSVQITPEVIEKAVKEAEEYLVTPCEICGNKIKRGEEGYIWGHKQCLEVTREFMHQKIAEEIAKDEAQKKVEEKEETH